MTVRFLGSGLIAFTCAWYGFSMARGLRYRRDFLREIISAISFIGREIEYGRSRLREVFKKVEKTILTDGFFDICIENMEQKGIRESWRLAVDDAYHRFYLTTTDKEVIGELSNELGMSDAYRQKSAIEKTVAELEKFLNDANENYVRLSKVFRGCGVLLGVFFLIIFA